MKKYEKVKRTNKSSRQALLQQILAECLEELRLKCFPWQRRNFLYHDIVINETDFEDNITAGRYQKIEQDNKYDYYHLIWKVRS